VTILSPLTPQQASQRLQSALPRMNVPPDAGTLVPIKRIYNGRVQDSSFWLQGPLGKHTGTMLGARGTISSHPRGSLVQMTIYPASSIVRLLIACACGLLIPILWWILDGAISAGPLVMVPIFVILGLVSYALGVIGVGTQLGYLASHLQSLFVSVPQTATPPQPHEAVPPVASPPPVVSPYHRPAIDHTWSARATLMMIGAFVFGGIGVLISCIGIPSIFLAPAFDRHQTAERMVETPCEIVDSRIVEEHTGLTKTERSGSGYKHVPSGEIRTSYKPEFLIRYQVERTAYETWTHRFSHFSGFASRSDAEQVLQQFIQGQEYPCWYDPLDPELAVLERSSGAWIVLPFAALFTAIFFGPSACAIIVGFVLLRKLRRGGR
jgi:hypothetical protein